MFTTCPWLVQVPSGHPEPDFPEDLYNIVECGAPIVVDTPDYWECEAGHHHHTYGSPGQIAEERAEAFIEYSLSNLR